MPLYLRIKDAHGYSMIEQPEPRPIMAEPVLTPLSPTGVTEAKRFVCTACTPHKNFPSPGVAAIHFSKRHGELKTEKASWRTFVKEERV